MSGVLRILRAGLRPALLFGFGAGIALFCGRRGFMPLDQSIVFDGGWRVLSGQVPFRDYVAPNGFAVHALQAAFFGAFGVSWLSYLLHAACLNGLFAVAVDRWLRIAGAGGPVAFLCGAASALALTPPMGVPYMDSHAFFFSLVAVGLAIEARRSRSKACWAAIPAVLVVAAACKQVPSAFAVPLVLGLAALGPWGAVRSRLGWLGVGTAGSLALLVVLAVAAGAEPELVGRYFFEVPASEAPRRLAQIGASVSDFWRDLRSIGVTSIVTVPAAFLVALGLCAREGVRADALRRLGLATALIALSLAFGVVTLNQAALSLPPLFLAVGLAWAGLRRFTGPSGRSRVAAAMAFALLCAAGFDAWRIHTRVNLTRSANDIRWDPAIADRAAGALPQPLSSLAWQVPTTIPYTAPDLAEVTRFLSQQEENFLLLGDASILYALAGKPSVAPALWLHPGLTIPLPGEPEFDEYEDWLLRRVDTQQVRYLVLEGRHSWNHVTIDDFPRLAARVRAKKTPRRHFGGFRVVDLGRPSRSE